MANAQKNETNQKILSNAIEHKRVSEGQLQRRENSIATKVLSEGNKSLAEEYRPVEQPIVAGRNEWVAFIIRHVSKGLGLNPLLLANLAELS